MPRVERIVFFGTPEFAVPALDALVAAGRAPTLVVTQPARPAGRGRRLVDPPVAARARELALEIGQPPRVRAPEFLASLRERAPDLAVVVAFGQIFPRELLELPPHGCLNVHASLLPRWRGAAPIAAAIEAGDAKTGVVVQRMVEALDAGPMVGRRETAIGPEETTGSLAERLARLGAEALLETIEALEAGTLREETQDEAAATYAPKLSGPARLDPSRPASELERLVRSRTPAPGADLSWRGGSLRVLAARALPGIAGIDGGAQEGVFLGVAGSAARLATGGGSVLELLNVQRPGRAPVSGRDFANGARLIPGERFGGEESGS
ncbi:MAG: methionyl-tRNA formyltransferase [Acidobacteria bacterium]|nr:methionyl-tRNA formyltransferase [Acidobacteriota bacterium]